MKNYILLLPIIFIFHDMEEIVGFERFFEKNPDIFVRFPRIMKAYRNYSTDSFALAVYEEFIPFFGGWSFSILFSRQNSLYFVVCFDDGTYNSFWYPYNTKCCNKKIYPIINNEHNMFVHKHNSFE